MENHQKLARMTVEEITNQTALFLFRYVLHKTNLCLFIAFFEMNNLLRYKRFVVSNLLTNKVLELFFQNFFQYFNLFEMKNDVHSLFITVIRIT